MSYYFNNVVKDKNFDDAIVYVKEELKKEGFGIVSEINMTATLKNKLDVDFKNYRILGACSPKYAHNALLAEDKIGVFLPCNVVVEENENGEIEVSAVDPIASMISVGNEELSGLATEIQTKLKTAIANMG